MPHKRAIAVLALALLACGVGRKAQKEKQSAAPSASAAETGRLSIERVCGWLDGIGMAGGQWRDLVSEWGCTSGYRELPDGSVMGFYVTGTATTVKEAHVTWNEVVANKTTAARDKFLVACDALNRKATGMSMASAPKNAIETRESGQWQHGGIDVSVEVEQLLPKATVRSVRFKVVPK